MRCLVLGGNGFIGTHLVRALLLAGVRPRVLDRAGSLRGEEQSGVEYLFGDFSDPSIVAEVRLCRVARAPILSATLPAT
jgi:UDP-glucose 4-epimerase